MAKRNSRTPRTNGTTTNAASDAQPPDTMERRLVAFAEQLGRMVGTIQAKAEGWLDPETLNTQVATVRDSAANLLEHLAGSGTTAPKKKRAASPRKANKGRSGGAVDAPGKKHRTPIPTTPSATLADSQAAKMRAAMPMAKTNRRRGRG